MTPREFFPINRPTYAPREVSVTDDNSCLHGTGQSCLTQLPGPSAILVHAEHCQQTTRSFPGQFPDSSPMRPICKAYGLVAELDPGMTAFVRATRHWKRVADG